MTLVFGIVAGVGIAGALALSAFRQNVAFYFDPSKVAAGQVKPGEHFRLGGMVVKGSVKREPGSLEVHFVVTDFAHDVPVVYDRVLPDLFREGTGVVAHGHLDGHGTFVADEVLAKHDENYMPPEVAKSLKRRHGEAREEALDSTATPPTTGAAEVPNVTPVTGVSAPPGSLPKAGAATQMPNGTSATGVGTPANTIQNTSSSPNTQASALASPSKGG
jgi:cytochrome c-type biogenesis protein CcmE